MNTYEGHSVPCEDGTWHWIGPWPSGAEMLTGRDNAVIFDPAQVFKLIQISAPDRALIADAPKLLAQRDALVDMVQNLRAMLPDSRGHEDDACWGRCWDELDGDAQDEVQAVRREADILLGTIIVREAPR